MLSGTNLFSAATATLNIALTDSQGYAMFASCNGAAPTTAGVFQHGCLMNRFDSGTGTNALYQNTGSVAVPSWTLLDTGVEQDATVLVDSNAVISVSVGTTASAVNGLVITNSATGAVSANAVLIAPGAPSGSDAAISLTINAKGVTGLIVIGNTDGTGKITVGSSTGAQTLVLGGGAGVSTVQIAGGSAANVVTIADVQTAGSISIGNAMTSGTVSIAGGSAVMTGAIIIGSSGATTSTTTIRGGTGTGAITLTPGTAGTIVIGATAGTGAITLGSSTGVQTVNVGTGTGSASTVNVATNGATGNVVNVATGAFAATVTIGNSTGATIVNILSGTGGVAIGRGSLKANVSSSTVTALGTTQNSTPTAAQLRGGVVTQTGATGAGTFTLDNGTNISGAVSGVAVGDTFTCIFANLGGGQTITITGATGSTVVGTAAVPSGKFATMTFVNTGSNAWTVYCVVSA